MKISLVARLLQNLLLVVLLAGSTALLAQAGHSSEEPSPAQGLVKAIRESTAKFQDVNAAIDAKYTLTFGCVTGPDAGAMGLHYVNFNILGKGILDPAQPTILIYEPQPDGTQKLIGADFLILASQWDPTHPGGAPQLMGQLFQFFESPNRFGLPPFYTLHVWAWKQNPNGAFVNWHPHVSCQSFTGQ
ncbi:MAG TPA: hypothetical protein VKH81_01920 [Candidatus Angelobacter sp.]|nr:hypothetical protein [Candidatus Angelobacter sp.]